jgi:hypothetical protein
MRFSLAVAGALVATALFNANPARAFTFENPSAANPGATGSNAASGYVDTDPKALMQPLGEDVPGAHYDESPAARNNGFAAPPDPSNSVGPRWLYGPSH